MVVLVLLDAVGLPLAQVHLVVPAKRRTQLLKIAALRSRDGRQADPLACTAPYVSSSRLDGSWMIAQPALGAGLMQVMEALHLQTPRGAYLHMDCYSSPVIGCWLLKNKRQHWTKSPGTPTSPCRRTNAIYKAVMKPCFETRQLPRCRDAYGDIIPPHRARTRATPPARSGGPDSRWARPMEAPADEIGAGGSMPAPAATLPFTLKIYTPPDPSLRVCFRHVPLPPCLPTPLLVPCRPCAYPGRLRQTCLSWPGTKISRCNTPSHALSSTCPGTCVGLKTHPGTDTCPPW